MTLALHQQRLAQAADLHFSGATGVAWRVQRIGVTRHQVFGARPHAAFFENAFRFGLGRPELPQVHLLLERALPAELDEHQHRHAKPALAAELEVARDERGGGGLEDFHRGEIATG